MRIISAKYIGLIAGGLMVLTSVILFYGLHLPDTGLVNYICYALFTLAIIVSLFNFKNNFSSDKTFKDYFSEGFKTFVIIVLIMAVFTFIFYKMNPDILEGKLAEINKYNSLDRNKTPGEVIENSNQLRKVFIPMTVATTTIMYLFLGALITAIGAGLLSQRNKI